MFVAHNVIERGEKEGWSLLRCLRSFSIVDLYLALESHTEHTLAAGKQELRNFAKEIKVCILLSFTLIVGMPFDNTC